MSDDLPASDQTNNLQAKIPAQDNGNSSNKAVAEDKKINEAVGSLYKEAGPAGVIEKKEFAPSAEVKEYITEVKKEKAIDLKVPIEDEFGAILMESASPSKPKIFLPLDEQGLLQGMKQKVTNSVRWLVTWCLRLIKMFPERVFYKNLKK